MTQPAEIITSKSTANPPRSVQKAANDLKQSSTNQKKPLKGPNDPQFNQQKRFTASQKLTAQLKQPAKAHQPKVSAKLPAAKPSPKSPNLKSTLRTPTKESPKRTAEISKDARAAKAKVSNPDPPRDSLKRNTKESSKSSLKTSPKNYPKKSPKNALKDSPNGPAKEGTSLAGIASRKSSDSKKAQIAPDTPNTQLSALNISSSFSGSSFHSSPNAATLPRPSFMGKSSPPSIEAQAQPQTQTHAQPQNGIFPHVGSGPIMGCPVGYQLPYGVKLPAYPMMGSQAMMMNKLPMHHSFMSPPYAPPPIAMPYVGRLH